MADIDDLISIHERLSILEATTKRIERDIVENTNQQTGIETRLDDIQKTLTQYKGFIGGIVFVFSCIFAFLKLIPGFLGLMK